MSEKDPSKFSASLQELKSMLIKYKESDKNRLLSDSDQLQLENIIKKLEVLTNEESINKNQDFVFSIQRLIQSITTLLIH
ncbi:hypothetical protein MEO93_26290 [Dolichospermum sp. ST_sed3]|nr:hypothetical protein [Dolichospermum sp. ST_sed3]